jgi:hypothetical protein
VRPLLVLPALAALLLTGCLSETDPGSQPADPSPTRESPTSTPGDTPSQRETDETSSAEPSGDPLTFGSSGGSITVRCFPRGERRMVFLDSVTTDRAVTLRDVTTDAGALRVTGTSVRRLAQREVTEAGIIDLRPGRTVAQRWPGAEPLTGAELEPGERYSFYVLADVVPDADLADLRIGWADDATTGTSTYDLRGRTRSGGC